VIIGKLTAAAIIAYLLGAIPFALIFGWLMGKVDITKHGSGNVGGTNVLRTVGIRAAIVVAILDLGKASLAVFLAMIIMGNDVLGITYFPVNWQFAQVLAAIMVMVGHNWSVYIKFRGGKGVAAYFGSWFVMCWPVALFGGIIVIITASLTRYVSMGSILGSLGILVLLIILTIVNGFPPIYLVYSVLAVIMIVYQHRRNIDRLQTRTELRLGDKVKMEKSDSLTQPPGAN
jgi:glycerol-3-phosphate acyltransferase PlsY